MVPILSVPMFPKANKLEFINGSAADNYTQKPKCLIDGIAVTKRSNDQFAACPYNGALASKPSEVFRLNIRDR